MSSMGAVETVAYSSTLFQTRQVYVYRLPPRSSVVAGYKANDWADPKTGDLVSTAIWKGRLRIVELEVDVAEGTGKRESRCEIRLEDADSGELFALCPYTVTPASDNKGGTGEAVEPVTDSSRYFVLRVESVDQQTGKTRRAFIGMGFEDRDTSFDFNVSLSSWAKRQRNAMQSNEVSGGPDEDGDAPGSGISPHLPKEGAKDLSLKAGQTFSVKLPGAGARKIRGQATSGTSSTGAGFGGGPLLPPPPSRRG